MSERSELAFARKHDHEHAHHYLSRQRSEGLRRQFSRQRDLALAREALKIAGEPGLVLDLPCGIGRFWPVLAEKRNRAIIGADHSEAMLNTALTCQSDEVVQRVTPLITSAFAIDLPVNAVDSIFCMRVLHRVADAEQRMALLREFHRVTRDSVILSLWVDGNYQAWRRSVQERRRAALGLLPSNRFVFSAECVEAEFAAAGFTIVRHLDFLPLCSMRRVYVLRKEHR